MHINQYKIDDYGTLCTLMYTTNILIQIMHILIFASTVVRASLPYCAYCAYWGTLAGRERERERESGEGGKEREEGREREREGEGEGEELQPGGGGGGGSDGGGSSSSDGGGDGGSRGGGGGGWLCHICDSKFKNITPGPR